MKFYNGLRFKIMVILLSVTLIPLLGLTALQMHQFDSKITDRIVSEVSKLSDTTSDRIDQWVNSKILQITETLNSHPEFSTMDMMEIKSYLNYIEQSDPELEVINLTDKNGMDTNRIDFSNIEIYTEPKKTNNLFIGDVVTSEVTNERTFVISIPRYDNKKNFMEFYLV